MASKSNSDSGSDSNSEPQAGFCSNDDYKQSSKYKLEEIHIQASDPEKSPKKSSIQSFQELFENKEPVSEKNLESKEIPPALKDEISSKSSIEINLSGLRLEPASQPLPTAPEVGLKVASVLSETLPKKYELNPSPPEPIESIPKFHEIYRNYPVMPSEKFSSSPSDMDENFYKYISNLRDRFSILLKLKGIEEKYIDIVSKRCFSKDFAFHILGVSHKYYYLSINAITIGYVCSKNKIMENINIYFRKAERSGIVYLNEVESKIIYNVVEETKTSSPPLNPEKPLTMHLQPDKSTYTKNLPSSFIYNSENFPNVSSNISQPAYIEKDDYASPLFNNISPTKKKNLTPSMIVDELLTYGVPLDEAEVLAQICNTTDDALTTYTQNHNYNFSTTGEIFNPEPRFYEENRYGLLVSNKKLYIKTSNFRCCPKYNIRNNLFYDKRINLPGFSETNRKIQEFLENKPKKILKNVSYSVSDSSKTQIRFQDFYSKEMRKFVLTYSEEPFSSFSIDCEDISNVQSNNRLLIRLRNEIETLKNSLPCDQNASIFIQVDSSCFNRQRVLISGPEGTPYANGLFMFELYEPMIYPSAPPKIMLMTTGNGTVNFSPSLSRNGFVCMSIINTASSGNYWNSETSGIHQILVSLQSLIMREHILNSDNEYQAYDGDTRENFAYAMQVKYANMKYAMIDLIKNHPPEFRDIIKKHFLLKRYEILRNAKIWVEEASIFKNLYGHFNDELDQEINSIDPKHAFEKMAEMLRLELAQFLKSD